MRKWIIFLLMYSSVMLWFACSDMSTEPQASGDEIVNGVNVTQLFAPPSQSEIDAVFSEWSTRDVSVQDLEIVAVDSIDLGPSPATVKVVSHSVAGVKHYGAVVSPLNRDPGSLPVIVWSHGGDQGENASLTLGFFPLVLGSIVDSAVYVMPSFRSEPLTVDGVTYLSEGPASPWDFDVDDGLALLNVALDIEPAADPERIGLIGFSRGAGVGLLMAVRDPRIDAVVEFFGPTDWFGEFVQEVTIEALEGNPRDLPGSDYINDNFVTPLLNGASTVADIRPELVRRSPVYWADRLPNLQVHHGTADSVVYVSQGERLIDIMSNQLGRSAPEFEGYLYEGAGHNPFVMPGSLDRSVEFFRRLRNQ